MATPTPETDPALLTLILFGPMRVLVGGHPLPPLHSRKSLWLLALLALRHGRTVEREWLAGTLWPDADQDRAFANLRLVLSDLRRALNGQSARLQAPDRRSLCLDLVGADCDVFAFDTAIASGEPLARARAVALYAGPLLEGCAEEWVPQERRSREEDCLRALQTLADDALVLGNWAKASECFRRAVDLDPWRDAPRRGLMEALARGGDTNAALQVYREFITLLRADPKAAPDKETSAIYTRLRAKAKQPAAEPQSGPAIAVGQVASVSGYLPHPLTDLVGREDERLEVAGKLRRSRLVTLTGPGGIGKTRLAIEVAAEAAPEFGGGVWLVALEALSDGGRVAAQIASVLGLKDLGRSPLESVTERLRRERALLVLDNCEHVLIACAQIAMHLLQECSGVRILATSREALGIMGEMAWAVPALSVPNPAHLPASRATLVRVVTGYEGVQLFVERAQAVQKMFALTGENASAVAQVCARVEGIPLAIELAAARVKAMTVAQIAERLDDHLSLLTASSQAGPPRQQTLRAMLDWSYSLLDERERLLLGRLAVFVGGWTLEAAEAVCSEEGIAAHQVLDLLRALVGKSLAVFEAGKIEGRYRFLETVRQYAADRLESGSEARLIRVRHRNCFRTLAAEAGPLLRGPDQAYWLRRVETEYDNLRAALEWDDTDADAGLQLANHLSQFWQLRGDYAEARYYLGRALEHAGEQAGAIVRARALNGAGSAAYYQSDYSAAQALFEESLRLRREAGDARAVAEVLGNLGNVAHDRSDYTQARALREEALEMQRALGDSGGMAITLGNLGNSVLAQSGPAAAAEMFEQSLRLYRERGERRGILWMLTELGGTAYRQCDYGAAQSYLEESLALARETAERPDIAFSLLTLGNVSAAQGDLVAAQSFLEESLALYDAMGQPVWSAWTRISLGNVARARSTPGSARALYEHAQRRFIEIGERHGEGCSLCCLGNLVQDEGNPASARALYREGVTIFHALRVMGRLAESLAGLAVAEGDLGSTTRAAYLWGASEALRESVNEPIPPIERTEYNRRVAQTRAALGEDVFTAAWAEGRALTWEQAAAYALEESVLEGK